jgi:chromosome segregation ATPase
VENKPVLPELDPRYINIYQKLGQLEGVLVTQEKQLSSLSSEYNNLEKNVNNSMQELKKTTDNIEKSLAIMVALEQDRRQNLRERKEDKKTTISYIPIGIGIMGFIIGLFGSLWTIFTYLSK